jgi:hypothetical protein
MPFIATTTTTYVYGSAFFSYNFTQQLYSLDVWFETKLIDNTVKL